MNRMLEPEDVVVVIKSFLDCNAGDEATECLILSIGAELLDISEETLIQMIEEEN
jgi:hypothetical protein